MLCRDGRQDLVRPVKFVDPDGLGWCLSCLMAWIVNLFISNLKQVIQNSFSKCINFIIAFFFPSQLWKLIFVFPCQICCYLVVYCFLCTSHHTLFFMFLASIMLCKRESILNKYLQNYCKKMLINLIVLLLCMFSSFWLLTGKLIV